MPCLLASIAIVTVMLWTSSSPAQQQRPKLVVSISTPMEFPRVAVSRDGRTLITPSRLWSLPTGELLARVRGARGLMFSSDGKIAITRTWGKVYLWDAVTGEQRAELVHALREDTVFVPVLSPLGDTIVTRSSLESAQIWDVRTGKPLTKDLAHTGLVQGFQFSSDGRWLMTDEPAGVRIWDAKTGELVRKISGNDSAWPRGASFSRDCRRAVTCNKDKKIRIWDIQMGQLVGNALDQGSPPTSARFGANDVLLSRDKKHAYLWYGATGKAPRKEKLPHNGAWMVAADFLPDGRHAITANTRTVALWRVGKGQPLWQHNIDDGEWNTRLTVSDDGRFVLVHTPRQSSRVYDLKTGDVVMHLETSTACLAGSLLVTGNTDGVKVWRLPEDERRE